MREDSVLVALLEPSLALDIPLPEVDVDVVEKNMEAQERMIAERRAEAAKEDPDSPPTSEELAIPKPSNLLPPPTEGKSRGFAVAVEAYLRAQAKAGWPSLEVVIEVQMGVLLATAEDHHNHGLMTGDVEVMVVHSTPAEARKDPLLLHTWLACLWKFPENATIVEDDPDGLGVSLMLKC